MVSGNGVGDNFREMVSGTISTTPASPHRMWRTSLKGTAINRTAHCARPMETKKIKAMRLSDRLLPLIGPTVAIGICIMLSGCGGNSVNLWSTESKSPHGDWVAQAHTLQSSGFGTAAVGTGVYLKRTGSPRTLIQVLGFSNGSAYPVGVTSVKLAWITNSHLDVTYNQDAKLNFQVTKASGVEITAHQSSGLK